MTTTARQRADKAIQDWTEAYRYANGKEPPRCEYRNGWIRIAGSMGKKRVAEFEAMAERMRARVS